MKTQSRITILILLIIVVAIGAYQGARINHAREAESFYRWLLATAEQYRVDGRINETLETGARVMDKELFTSVNDVVEQKIPDALVPFSDEDLLVETPQSKLVRIVRDAKDVGLIWALATGPELAGQRTDYLKYLREKKLSSVASELNLQEVYTSESQTIGVNPYNLFFGFRKIAANFLWLKVDKFWHQGMMHRMIPLMKTCVTLDPNFVEAYLVGAWHLAYNMTAHLTDTPEQFKKYDPKYRMRVGEKERYYLIAIDFLKDGIRKNPWEYRLYFDLGYSIYSNKLKDYANAVRYLSEAIRHRHDRWVPRMLYLNMRLNGQYEEAIAGWEDYQRKFPGKEYAAVEIPKLKGLIFERDAEKALKRAEAATDPQTAEAERAESKRLYAEAAKIWQQMYNEGQDPFALGRLKRIQAIEYAQQGRYLEAVAGLDYARWESNEFWDEASDMIIDIKQKGGIPLSLSEQKAVIRKQEAELYLPKTINGLVYEFRDDGWYLREYVGQPTTELKLDSEQLNALKQSHPEINEILTIFDRKLGNKIVFQFDDQWFTVFG